MEKEEREQEITVPGLLTLHRDGKITRFEVAQGDQDIISSTISSKDILLQPHNLKARLYLPSTDPASSSSPQLPLILFFHGGGFVSLSPSTPACHSFCTHLSTQAHSIVISVAYRLAPEHRLPAAFEDGFSSLLWLQAQSLSTLPNREPWLASHANFAQIFLAGVSSGASIAHHVALQASKQDVHVAGLVLVVPFLGGQLRTQSEIELAESSSLPLQGCDTCWALSLPLEANRDHPFSNVNMASQKLWADKSTPWPPSLVVIGGKDILHDRQVEYTQQLHATGREVIMAKFDDADHFMSDIFPCDFAEWEPLEALTGTFEVVHADFGKLLYAGVPASVLLEREIFFFEATYIVPTTAKGYGKLESIPTPNVGSTGWAIPDNASVAFTCKRIECDIQNAMKCTYGSHRATITMFMPLHLFVFLFRVGEVHRTPTMWIAKGEGALSRFLPRTWNAKVVQHNGDTIRCCVVEEKLVVRYHIGKQQLSIVFPYRRWRRTGGGWDALDSDMVNTEQVEIHLSERGSAAHDVTVNNNWSLANLREYVGIRFGWKGDFNFVVDGIPVRKRKETSLLCREIHFPRCIIVEHANPL